MSFITLHISPLCYLQRLVWRCHYSIETCCENS